MTLKLSSVALDIEDFRLLTLTEGENDMAVGKPMTDFGFELIDKQTVLLKIKETKIVDDRKDKDTGEKKKSGREFQVRLELMGGHQEGLVHTEFFYEETKGEFSLFKLAGLLQKAGIMPVSETVDTDMFKTDTFRKKFATGISGKMLGGTFKHGKNQEGEPRAELSKYLTVEETKAILAKSGTAAVAPVAVKPIPKDTAADGWM